MSNDLQPMEEKDFSFNAEEMSLAVEKKTMSSPEIAQLEREIDIADTQSIMKFGENTAENVTALADQILNTMSGTFSENSGLMLKQLNKIMERFDAKDFEEEKDNGFFGKIFKSGKITIDQLLKKYETMGGEVDKVYVELKKYEREIQTTNTNLEDMFNTNIAYYETLQKYIYAGNNTVDALKNNELKLLQDKATTSGEQIDHINANNMIQSIDLIEQRVYDLELAKNVALQSLPQIKMIQKGNYNLMRKINSAFIVTLPVFKQSLTQAIALKRQGIQAEAMAALDEKTNELLMKNAINTAEQSKITAQLASGPGVNIDTLEKTWTTILEGIEETQRIQSESRETRRESLLRLEQLNQEFKEKAKLT